MIKDPKKEPKKEKPEDVVTKDGGPIEKPM